MKYKGLRLRHELKYFIPYADYHAMRTRIAMVMRPDENMNDYEPYHVRSLYFDDALRANRWDKESGVENRTKHRIRIYNKNPDFIRLEKKVKIAGFIAKKTAKLSVSEFRAILRNDLSFLLKKDNPFLHEFYAECKIRQLRPVVTVDYNREAYTYREGNVRVTFDTELQAAFAIGETWDIFSDDSLVLTSVYPPQIMTMEVKYDDFLPSQIKNIIRPYTARRSEASKYVMSLRALDITHGRLTNNV